jgi:hypothetical protein
MSNSTYRWYVLLPIPKADRRVIGGEIPETHEIACWTKNEERAVFLTKSQSCVSGISMFGPAGYAVWASTRESAAYRAYIWFSIRVEYRKNWRLLDK